MRKSPEVNSQDQSRSTQARNLKKGIRRPFVKDCHNWYFRTKFYLLLRWMKIKYWKYFHYIFIVSWWLSSIFEGPIEISRTKVFVKGIKRIISDHTTPVAVYFYLNRVWGSVCFVISFTALIWRILSWCSRLTSRYRVLIKQGSRWCALSNVNLGTYWENFYGTADEETFWFWHG